VLMRLVWMSYNRSTAFLICFFVARTSVMNTCASSNRRCTHDAALVVAAGCSRSPDRLARETRQVLDSFWHHMHDAGAIWCAAEQRCKMHSRQRAAPACCCPRSSSSPTPS
jgi:hypothetical protein